MTDEEIHLMHVKGYGWLCKGLNNEGEEVYRGEFQQSYVEALAKYETWRDANEQR